jgi:hypothetical protein
MIDVSECSTRARSLWRRVRPVLLAASLLFVCSTVIAAAKRTGVTLDMKDADVHVVLKSIQKQCRIRNLVIDPGVTSSGTFLFHDVPCKLALDTVMKTTGLAAESYPNSVMTVRKR